jgi:hypothetical protein
MDVDTEDWIREAACKHRQSALAEGAASAGCWVCAPTSNASAYA